MWVSGALMNPRPTGMPLAGDEHLNSSSSATSWQLAGSLCNLNHFHLVDGGEFQNFCIGSRELSIHYTSTKHQPLLFLTDSKPSETCDTSIRFLLQELIGIQHNKSSQIKKINVDLKGDKFWKATDVIMALLIWVSRQLWTRYFKPTCPSVWFHKNHARLAQKLCLVALIKYNLNSPWHQQI